MNDPGLPAELEGPHGRFRVDMEGMLPEKGYAFLYEDDRHRFFFFARIDAPSPPEFRISIWYASTEHRGGDLPRISSGEVKRIEENLRHFFRTRQFFSIHEPIVKSIDRPEDISFSWKFW